MISCEDVDASPRDMQTYAMRVENLLKGTIYARLRLSSHWSSIVAHHWHTIHAHIHPTTLRTAYMCNCGTKARPRAGRLHAAPIFGRGSLVARTNAFLSVTSCCSIPLLLRCMLVHPRLSPFRRVTLQSLVHTQHPRPRAVPSAHAVPTVHMTRARSRGVPSFVLYSRRTYAS